VGSVLLDDGSFQFPFDDVTRKACWGHRVLVMPVQPTAWPELLTSTAQLCSPPESLTAKEPSSSISPESLVKLALSSRQT